MTALRRLFVFLVVLGAVTCPGAALAQDPPVPSNAAQLSQRQATFGWEKQTKGPDLLTASFSYVDVVDGGIRTKLASGLPTEVVMRAYLLREGETDPIALAARTCSVTLDLWEEVYSLKISGPGGPRSSAALNIDGVLRQCFQAVKLPVADRSLFALGKKHFLGVIVEVNPVNDQMLQQMRKWVSRPAGSTGIGPGDALFGSFVSLFVKQIGTADRTLQFRTQSVLP